MASGHWNKAAGQGEAMGPTWTEVAEAVDFFQRKWDVFIAFEVYPVLSVSKRWGWRAMIRLNGETQARAAGWGGAYENSPKSAPAALHLALLGLDDDLTEEAEKAERKQRMEQDMLW